MFDYGFSVPHVFFLLIAIKKEVEHIILKTFYLRKGEGGVNALV